MSVVAAIRPDGQSVALLVHVVGAMILVGGLVTAATALLRARGAQEARLSRMGYFSLLAICLPGWILMRIGAQWIYSKQGWDKVDSEPDWLGIGYVVADAGGLLLLVALIVGGIGVRRLNAGGGAGLLKSSGVIATVLLAAYVVAVWAMSGKPG